MGGSVWREIEAIIGIVNTTIHLGKVMVLESPIQGKDFPMEMFKWFYPMLLYFGK
jgi:hypothetical protein